MSTSGPTRGAEQGTVARWKGHPVLSRAVRAAAWAIPLLVGIVVARAVAVVMPQPDGIGSTTVFLGATTVVAIAAATATDRATRRLLPLSTLLGMSLIFPDEAPSRFKVALRAGSTKRVARRLLTTPEGETHAEAAQRVLELVAALGRHDRLTRGHTERVRAYADLIAEELALPRHDRDLLRWSVLVHDIGKIRVPGEILNKADPLTDAEWEVLKQHPEAGAELVAPLVPFLGDWSRAASEHHERFDGGGYPSGISGTDISLAGRIVAVADAYDVITSARSYKKPMSADAARAELVRCAGTQFDPMVVRAMVNVSLGGLRLSGGPLGALSGRMSDVAQVASSGGAIATSAVAAVAIAVGAAGASPSGVHDAPSAARVAPVVQVDGTPATTTTVIAAGDVIVVDGVPVAEVGTAPTSTSIPTPTSTPGGPIPAAGATSTIAPRSTGTTTSTTVARQAVPSTTRPPIPAPATTAPPPPPPPPTTSEAPNDPLPPPAPPATTAPPTGPTPNLRSDTVSTKDDKDVSIDVLSNDLPLSGSLDPATLIIVTPPNYAKDVRVHDDHLHFRSLKGFAGTDSLTYRVCDTSGACGTAVVTITVVP